MNSIQSRNTEDQKFSFLYLFLVISFIVLFKGPFYYLHNYLAGTVGFLIGFCCIFYIVIKQRSITINMLIVIFAWLLIEIWKLLPFRENVAIGPGYITIILLVGFLALNNENKFKFLQHARMVGAILGLLSFVVMVLLVTGLDLPYYHLEQTFRNPNQFYYLFPGTLVLSSQLFDLPTGGNIIRSSGLFFAEPGHFGVFLGLLLAANSFSFKEYKDKFILLGGISTVSGSFFAIFLVGIIAKYILKFLFFMLSYRIKIRNILLLVLSVFLSIGFIYSFINYTPERFQDRVLWNRFAVDASRGDSFLESRASYDFNAFFKEYSTTPQSLVGIGTGRDRVLRASDMRSIVVSYGWVIIFLYMLALGLIFLPSSARIELKIMIFLTLLVVTLHRVAYVDSLLVVSIISSALASNTSTYCIKK
ncbi:MAG: hypothetical protein ACOC3T_03290 [Bacteroidota bacterium]